MKISVDFLYSINYNTYWSTESEVLTLSPRTGRPKSENAMSKSIKIRFDDETYNKMTVYCESHSISRTEFIRQLVKTFLAK